MANTLIVTGDDGIARCGWASSDPEYMRYHDEEWGTPLHGDRAIFEKIALEGFQAGLSWITILKKREAFRRAFAAFDIARVAAFDERDIDRLLGDAGIIRNRPKIIATIANARITVELTAAKPGALDELVWSFVPTSPTPRPRSLSEVLATTPASTALSDALRAQGFRFVGPTTMHALMQSAGLINDHAEGCVRGDALERAVRAPRRE